MTTATATSDQVRFMAENPIMAAPPGWRLAPWHIAPDQDTDHDGVGWCIEDAEGVTRHQITEVPNGFDQTLVYELAIADPEATLIRLWRNVGKVDGGCWWAAVRESS